MNELITVGISCYNIERYIARAIESVLKQTHENLEILIVDDGSTDQSGAICDEYAARDNRIRVIHQENAGLGSTRNRVIEEMRGAWVAFVDGDDYVEPDMYETMLRACREYDCDLAVCGYATERDNTGGLRATNESWGTGTMTHFSAGNDQPVQCAEKRVIVPVPADSLAARSTSVLPRDELLTRYIEEDERCPIRNAAWNKLYHRNLIGAFRYPEHRYYEDIVTTTRILAATKKAVFVDRPLYHYIIDRGESIMNRGVNPRIISDQVPAYMDKNAFLSSIGRGDLRNTHEYLMYKKLLELYTQSRRADNGKTPEQRKIRDSLREVIGQSKDHVGEIFTSPIATNGQKLKLKLFLTHPVLYNCFTAVNERLIRPARGL